MSTHGYAMADDLQGAITLPDAARVRGRGLSDGVPEAPHPTFGLYLGSRTLRARHEPLMPWPQQWVVWPDFLVPVDRAAATAAIRDVHRRALAGDAVEVACAGGIGRTGTVIACLAVLAGLPPDQALVWARAHHHPRAVETPWQRKWITTFARDTAH
jgi:hypothetical protein